MTIYEYLQNLCVTTFTNRLSKLIEFDAPDILIEYEKKRITDPLGHIAKKGLQEFGHIEFSDVSEHIGWGGKPYLRFKDPNRPSEDILYVTSKWGKGKYLYRQAPKL